MRVGIFVNTEQSTLDTILGRVADAAGAGLDSAFFPQYGSWDALTLVALAGQRVSGIDLGTAVVPTYPRHPLALAGQALTAQAAAGGRLTLGVGPSHRPVVEGQYGHSYDRPADHVREYLTALRPLLRGEPADHHGRTLTAVGRVDVPGAAEPSVLLAALGPRMLRLAGELADGVVTVWTGPDAVAERIRPLVTDAASAAGRPEPRVVVTVLMSVTADPDRVLRDIDERFGGAARLPNYKAQLERQGSTRLSETVVAGDEATVERAVRRYARAGATELVASVVGDAREQLRTMELLAALRGSV
ncbi:TIGR03564 family F420-dependent LLM class oxidoreductase [Streptomyces sp. NPDC087420]|uniref:TIGR03564 family F420-dependent LLM class oxidoreductase n=1 Tax=Streptomyces sp. NPDC087420 TaxID=3365785 RepID=UPI00383576BA